jgi:radical SAM family uncharacterized protein
MSKLCLSDEILLNVEKPSRYIGNEINSIMKDKDSVEVRYALCFPDIYEIGMSHVGLPILYNLLNLREDTWAERVYSPWIDMSKIMREKKIPLFALESQEPIKNFDFLGFTIQYEMCYTNILDILDLSGIPLLSKDRTDDDPIVMGGGPCVYNTEPIADFIDAFYIGEAETNLDAIIDAYKEHKRQGKSRRAFLEIMAEIEGVYIPQFYDVEYKEDGTLKSFTPNKPCAKPSIKKQVIMDFTSAIYPDKPIVPFLQTVHDRVVLELFRGCIRGCRFCQAGMIYRPVREKEVETLKEQAKTLLKNTGHEEISLISLSSSDYTTLRELTYYLIDELGDKDVNISLPSLRIDAFAIDVMQKVQDVRKSSITFAPEAGSQRMRDVINKGLSKEDIINGANLAFKSGWSRVKLYFMLGLPTETVEDNEGIATLSQEIVNEYYNLPKQDRHGRLDVVTSTSFFIPKPFTPFQWFKQCTSEEFLDKQRIVNNKMNKRAIKYNWHDVETTLLEGVMARGDRRVGAAILEAYKNGCLFDSWTEQLKYDVWIDAFKKCGIDPAFYNNRDRGLDELFPWDFIDAGVTKEFLIREYNRAIEGTVTPNCRQVCSACGLIGLGGGVCYEDKN